MSDRDGDDYPSDPRLLAIFHALGMGAWRTEEAARILQERLRRRQRPRNPLDSPSGFHSQPS